MKFELNSIQILKMCAYNANIRFEINSNALTMFCIKIIITYFNRQDIVTLEELIKEDKLETSSYPKVKNN